MTGRRWVHALDARQEAQAARIAQTAAVPELVARVLAGRDVPADEIERFLRPTLRELMPDPSTLQDMEAAAARLADAVERGERVAIFGDYDVDGAASSALLFRYLRALGVEARIRIPDRLTEGYGPNSRAMNELADAGATLIVTVDCGSGGFEALATARARGVDVVVLDHHQTGVDLPEAVALVNPNRQDDLSGQGALCAAGVVFVTLAAVSRELRRRGRDAASLPDIRDDLDLVALATVCDVVPLTGFNRALVVRGLERMRLQVNPGLRALAEVARLSGRLEAFHLGYILGPRINAGGRIGAADLGSRLLTVEDRNDAAEIAEELHLLNAERQAMEREMLSEAEREVVDEMGEGPGPAVLIAGRSTWHPGIVGLIAARLKERFNRPAFAIAFDAGGRGTASGRSIEGFDIGAFVRDAVAGGVAVKGGGHRMAAGLTIERARLGDLRDLAEARARAKVDALGAQDTLRVDGAVSASALKPAMLHTLEQAGPFGAGHPAPIFALPRHRVGAVVPLKGGHMRLTLKAADGASASAIAFRAEGTPIGDTLLARRDELLHVAGHLDLDRYGGRESISLRVSDVAVPDL